MPLTEYICPDGVRIPCGECIVSCRMPKRCISLSTLRAIWEGEREWTGQPHVTDLLNGTMMTYLKIRKDYSVEPQSRAFALLGSTHHKMMEKSAEYPAEVPVEVAGILGTCDVMEHLGSGTWGIVDFKTWGAYRVARGLGMEEVGKEPDPNGGIYQRSGKWGKAGQPKMVTVYRENPNKAELENEIIQLNFYRIGIESGGMDVKSLTIQATVRDGGTVTAKGYGLGRLVYMIDVPIVDNAQVMGYLLEKKLDLEEALRHMNPDYCTDSECWGGKRCLAYCDVWESCQRGLDLRGGKLWG